MAKEDMKITETSKELVAQLDKLLGAIDLTDVSADSNDFQDLPEGYYLAEVENAKLTVSKSSGLPMVAFTFKVVEDGLTLVSNDHGMTELVKVKSSKNRKVFVYYPFKDEGSIKRFVKDMLKFEGDIAGEPILGKEYFTNSEILEDALDILIGMRIYIQVSVTANTDGTKATWQNLISWKRAIALELPN